LWERVAAELRAGEAGEEVSASESRGADDFGVEGVTNNWGGIGCATDRGGGKGGRRRAGSGLSASVNGGEKSFMTVESDGPKSERDDNSDISACRKVEKWYSASSPWTLRLNQDGEGGMKDVRAEAPRRVLNTKGEGDAVNSSGSTNSYLIFERGRSEYPFLPMDGELTTETAIWVEAGFSSGCVERGPKLGNSNVSSGMGLSESFGGDAFVADDAR
jgi:hypothetical protein